LQFPHLSGSVGPKSFLVRRPQPNRKNIQSPPYRASENSHRHGDMRLENVSNYYL
jgi:hypothetical protein